LEEAQHPMLVCLEYSFQTPEKIFFAMKFMKGGELFQHLKLARRFKEHRAKFYAACIVLGMGYLHDKDIAYRDLKPENVLMDIHGYVRLADFGMAKTVKKDEGEHSLCGTPEYLAPEVLLSTGHGKPSDWWALGILMYRHAPHAFLA